MSLNLCFWLGFLAAVLTSQVYVSDNRVNWPCDEETCFINLSTGNTGT